VAAWSRFGCDLLEAPEGHPVRVRARRSERQLRRLVWPYV